MAGTVTVKWRRKRPMEGADTALQVSCDLTFCKIQSYSRTCMTVSLTRASDVKGMPCSSLQVTLQDANLPVS